MIVEFKGHIYSRHIVNIAEILTVTYDEETQGSVLDNKKWHYVTIRFKDGCMEKLNFMEDKSEAEEKYNILLEKLKLLYSKDSVKELIKKAMEE